MNAKKAKALRREVCGDSALRQPRQYVQLLNHRNKKTGEREPGTIMNKPGSLRAKYQAAKRAVA